MVTGRAISFFAHLLATSIVCLSYALGFQNFANPAKLSYNADSKAAPITNLQMVRNIDLPEAIVFYGVESMMKYSSGGEGGDSSLMVLRPGVVRLINECVDVGTAALLLSEESGDDETSTRQLFQSACESSLDATTASNMQKIVGDHDNQVLHFRTPDSHFVCPPASDSDEESSDDQSNEIDESIAFYNLQSNGKSPSPAFLLDSLRSVNIDPRGFGGSSGFGRGQWVEPRRSPMTARTVVFIAGDWVTSSSNSEEFEVEEKSTVKDRCAAARAAGCRVIYLEHLSSDENLPVSIEDDEDAISLCDAVIDSFGNDNAREIQPVSLDAISTPGDYWLNPPNPRDDMGNAVAVDEIVEYFRSEREMKDAMSDSGCVVVDIDAAADEEISEDEMAAILADLDAI